MIGAAGAVADSMGAAASGTGNAAGFGVLALASMLKDIFYPLRTHLSVGFSAPPLTGQSLSSGD
jgi:hypothetical protein